MHTEDEVSPSPQRDNRELLDAQFAMRLSLIFGFAMLIGKTAAYFMTHSTAVFSDAAESVIHVIAVGFASFSLRLSTRKAPAVPEDKTRPGVFIIESLGFRDERKRRFEGQILRDMLTLSGKEVQYWYVRTWKELTDDIFQRFYDSKLRYLHLSCHGNSTHVCLTLDDVPFKEFGEEISNYLPERRLFVSACEVVNVGWPMPWGAAWSRGSARGLGDVTATAPGARFCRPGAFFTRE
jgi:hypothetical protein